MKLNSNFIRSNISRRWVLPKDHELSYLPLFKKEVFVDSFAHNRAGVLSMSRNVYNLLSSSFSHKLKKESGPSPALINNSLGSQEDSIRKTEYYNSATLKSENIYLKSQITELEEDIKKLYECNASMVKLNKTLDLKVTFYQKKINCFTDTYNQIIEHINTIFKKIGNFMLESQQGVQKIEIKSPTSKIRDKAKENLNSMFSQEMNDLKVTFKNLQEHIDSLNEEYSNIKHQPVTDYRASSFLSKILDPTPSEQLTPIKEAKSKSMTRKSEITPQPSLSHTRKVSRISEDVHLVESPKFSHYDTPLSTRFSKLCSPKRQIEIKIASPQERPLILDSFSSPIKKKLDIKLTPKNNSPLNKTQRKHVPPPKAAARNEVRKEPANKTSTHSRRSSVNQVTHLNNTGGVSQREAAKHIHHHSNYVSPKMQNGGLNDTGFRNQYVSNQKTSQKDNYELFTSSNTESSAKLQVTKAHSHIRQNERPESSRSELSSEKNNNIPANLEDAHSNAFRGETPKVRNPTIFSDLIKEYAKGLHSGSTDSGENNSGGRVSTGRDTYDNLKNYRKLIQNFRIDMSKVNGQTEINFQNLGSFKDISPFKTKR